jgi:hypothetical protein
MTHEEYLAHAEECERLAALANLRSVRRALLACAAMWRKSATDATRGIGPTSKSKGMEPSKSPERYRH